MPDTPSPFDDPLADLYGKLPDPRREPTAEVRRADAPTSRRAARAARGDTGPTAAQPPITRPPADPAPAPRSAASPSQSAADTRPAASQPTASQRTAAQTRPASMQTRPHPPQGGPGSTQARQSAPQARTATGSQAPRSGAPAVGTLDDIFTGRRSVEDLGVVPPPAERRRRRVGGWIALVIVLAIVGAVAVGGFWAVNTFGAQMQGMFAPDEREDFEAGIAQGEATITVVSGDAGPQVSQKLFDAGVTKASSSFYDYLIETSTVFTFQPGVFKLQQQMTSEAVLAALRDPANQLTNTAQLPEGLTVEQTVTRISEQTEIPLEDLQAAVADPAAYGVDADSLEGWLFPATYTFDPGTTASAAITRMVDRTIESLDAAGVTEGDRQRVLTVASIVQREARVADDFYRVSRVIQNRLDQGMQLQMDSTAQYGYGELHEGSASTSEDAQFDDNAWNTYVVPGLPVGPISNPGDQAIDAAIHPAEGSWLFFVTVNLDTGETVFTSTADDHEAAVEQWRGWCRDNPDSGC
ncbi:endolytic transglycosylase MltG [Microbacterium sp. P07]|uniref:endolytic transglycosylase MltG n=1 Tax=Microbacterium sp. P07 TaxID=3366952 RepID=UPI003744FBF2